MFVNDQALHGMTATSCAFNQAQVVEDFVSGGVEIMMIWIEAGIHCWLGPGKYDWSYAEQKLRFFAEHSGSTHWLIRVRLGLLNPWFGKTHPTEVHNPQTPTEGERKMSVANIASPVWRDQVSQMLEDFTVWLKTTEWAPRIIGFMLNAGSTEEWLIFDTDKTCRGDYHPVYTRELRQWLGRRYNNDVDALREAWKSPGVTFETADCPKGQVRNGSHIWGPFTLRDPAVDRPAIDYYHFLNETLADHLLHFCRAVKQAAGTPILCGGFHSYLWWETGVYSYIQEYGHGLIQRLCKSPDIDFVSDITSYDMRYPGGPSGYLGLAHTLNLNNKLHYTEVDLSTTQILEQSWQRAWAEMDPASARLASAEPAIPDPIWKWAKGYCGRDWEEQIAILQREHAHNLITGTPYWWFDIRKNNYQHPKLVQAMARLSEIGKQAVDWDRSSISEVAFVCSEQTPMYQSAMNGTLLRFEMESSHGLLLDGCNRGWGMAGIPFDTYELHDLAHDDFPGEQYKLIIFVNCGFISDRAAEGIRRWQRDGRVMTWTFVAGVLNETRIDPAMSADLIGMTLNWSKHRRNIRVLIEDDSHPLCVGGSALDFGIEGSVGPVMFVDDLAALPLGRLRDGGEVGFALRDHGDWKSVYLSMMNFGPALLRNLTRFARGHVWCESGDVIYANRSMICLHTASQGRKTITLPGRMRVTDLLDESSAAQTTNRITHLMPPYRTAIWRIEPEKP